MNQLRKTLSFMTAAVFLTGISSVAMAQDAGKAGAAKPDAAKADAVKADPDKVLATINGAKITSKDVDQISADLDPQIARLPDEQRR